MKEKYKIRALAILLLLGLVSCSSLKILKGDFTSFYETYKDDTRVFSLSLPMFFANTFVEDKDGEAKHILRKFNSIKLFVSKDKNNYYSTRIKSYLPKDIYFDLMQVNKGSGKLNFKIRKSKGGEIKELILTIVSKDGFIALALKGDVTIDEAKRIVNLMKVGGMKDISRSGFKFLDNEYLNFKIFKKNKQL